VVPNNAKVVADGKHERAEAVGKRTEDEPETNARVAPALAAERRIAYEHRVYLPEASIHAAHVEVVHKRHEDELGANTQVVLVGALVMRTAKKKRAVLVTSRRKDTSAEMIGKRTKAANELLALPKNNFYLLGARIAADDGGMVSSLFRPTMGL